MEFVRFINNFFPSINTDHYKEHDYVSSFKSPDINTLNELMSWPPNVFIILYSVVEYTDKYRLLVSPQSHISWGG